MAHSTLPSVLLTRPAPQSKRWAELLSSEFGDTLSVTISPVIEVETLDVALPEAAFNGVIFTSANAVTSFAQLSADRTLKAYCVGDRTASVATAHGFEASSAAGTVDDLASLVLRDVRSGTFLYPHGAHTARDLAGIFASTKVTINDIVTYRQTPQTLNSKAISLLSARGPVLIPLFSPRSAEIFVSNLSQNMKSDQIAICFSEAVREKASVWRFSEVRVCPHPTQGEMIRLMRDYFKDGSA